MNILIVDDHMLFREGMKLLLGKLQPSSVCIDAGNLDDALLAASSDNIDLALFDLGLPGVSGIEALSAFRRANDRVPTVVLSALDDRQIVFEALAHGAKGFVSKAASPDSLLAAMRTVLDQGIYVPEAVLDSLPSTPFLRRAESMPSRSVLELGLTDRQAQVFRLVMQGKSNKAIARDLRIAESTVKLHVKPILRMLNVRSRVGAILEATRRGFSLEH